MQPVVNNAKSHDTEPGCQAYFFFQPADGSEDFLYGVEMYIFLFWMENIWRYSYDTEKDIKETHFSSDAFQGFQAYKPLHSLTKSVVRANKKESTQVLPKSISATSKAAG